MYPRVHKISEVFKLKIIGGEILAGDDAEEASLFSFDNLPELAFDHKKIISDFLENSLSSG